MEKIGKEIEDGDEATTSHKIHTIYNKQVLLTNSISL